MRVNPITFTANIVVQSMCEELGYNDRIVVNGLAGSPIYQGAISIYPNPFKIVDSPDEGKGATKEMPYWAVGFGVIKDGTYFAYCNISPKHGKCFYLKDPILCKGRSTYSVPCRNRQTPMINCEIHSGGLNPDSPTGFGINPNWRGSTGCLTIPPTDWINFIRLFNNGDKLQITIKTNQDIIDKEPGFFNLRRGPARRITSATPVVLDSETPQSPVPVGGTV